MLVRGGGGEVGREGGSQSSGRHCSGPCSFLFNAPSLHLGDQPGADLGPLISPEAKQRVCDLVQTGVDEGAKVRRLHAQQHTLKEGREREGRDGEGGWYINQ